MTILTSKDPGYSLPVEQVWNNITTQDETFRKEQEAIIRKQEAGVPTSDVVVTSFKTDNPEVATVLYEQKVQESPHLNLPVIPSLVPDKYDPKLNWDAIDYADSKNQGYLYEYLKYAVTDDDGTYESALQEAQRLFGEDQANAEVLASSNIWQRMFGATAAGVASPSTWLFMAPILKGATTVAKGAMAADLTASSVAKYAAKSTGLGLAEGVFQESILYPTSFVRTPEESVSNIAASGIVGGLVGVIAKGITNHKQKSYIEGVQNLNKKFVEATLNNANQKIMLDADGNPSKLIQYQNQVKLPKLAGTGADSVGAMARGGEGKRQYDLELYSPVFDKSGNTVLDLGRQTAYQGAYAVGKLLSPTQKGLSSPFATVRKITDNVFDHNYVMRYMNEEGLAHTSLERDAKNWMDRMQSLQLDAWREYEKFLGLDKVENPSSARLWKQQRAKNVKFQDWDEYVGIAMTHGDELPAKYDVDPAYRSSVNAAAKKYREGLTEVYDGLTELGWLPEDIQRIVSESYFTRIWDIDKINADRTTFSGIVKDFLVRTNRELLDINETYKGLPEELKEGYLKELHPKYRTSKGKLRKHEPNWENESITQGQEYTRQNTVLDAQVEQILDNITKENVDNFASPFDFSPKSGSSPLKSLMFFIDTADVQDYVVNSATEVFNRYSEYLVPRVLMGRYMRKEGYSGWEMDEAGKLAPVDVTEGMMRIVKTLEEEKKILEKDAPDGKARQKLAEDFKDAQKFIKDMFATFDGSYGSAGRQGSASYRVIRGLNNYSYIRLMGSVIFAATADLGALLFENSLGNYFKFGAVPRLKSMIGGIEGKNKNTYKHLAIGLESMKGKMFYSFASQYKRPETFKAGGKFANSLEKNVNAFSQSLGNLSGINQWTGWTDELRVDVTSAAMVEGITKLNKYLQKNGRDIEGMSKKLKNSLFDLNRYGVDIDEIASMSEQIEKHGFSFKGSALPNTHLWDDASLAKNFNDALKGSLRYQGGTSNPVSKGNIPFWSMTPVGSMVTQFKKFYMSTHASYVIANLARNDGRYLQGLLGLTFFGSISYMLAELSQGRKPDMDPAKLLFEGVSRGSGLGLFPDLYNMAGKLPLVGNFMETSGLPVETQRFYNRNLLGTFIGPAGGLLQDFAELLNNVRSGSFTEANAQAAASLLPYQNLHILRYPLRAGVHEASQAAGLKPPNMTEYRREREERNLFK